MNESNILECHNATITLLQRKVWTSIKRHYVKESNIPADNVKIKQLISINLLNRKRQLMSNILARNATIKELKWVVLLNRKGQYMKD